jgi:hypothetical protein
MREPEDVGKTHGSQVNAPPAFGLAVYMAEANGLFPGLVPLLQVDVIVWGSDRRLEVGPG